MTAPTTKPARPPRRPPPPVPGQKPAVPPQWMKPSTGLARPSSTKVKSESSTGGWASHEREDSYVDGPDSIIGTKTERTSVAGTGAKGSHETSSDVFDGKTQKQTNTKVEGLAGAEAAIKIVSMATEEELKIGMEALVRAGAFGEVAASAALKRGQASLTASGKAAGGAGVQGKLAAEARVDRSGLIPALQATVEASIQAGIWGSADAAAEAKFGPLVAGIVAHIEGFVGVSAEASMKAFASWKGVGAEFSAGVQAAASSKGSVTAEIGLGPAQLEVGAGYEAWAGARLDATGKLEIGITGVSASFKASAFAGAKFEAHGSAKFKLRGKTIVSAKGKVGVAVGAGAEIGGEFEIKNGKLKISGELAAALKGGVTAGAELELDFYSLAKGIVAEVGDLAKGSELKISDMAPDYDRKPIADPKQAAKQKAVGYEALIDDFHAYSRKKLTQGKTGIKKERVQEMIQGRAGQLHSAFAFVETDRGIEEAATEAFGPLLKEIDVQAGYVRTLEPAPAAAAEKHKQEFQQKEKWRVARDSLADAFREYGEEKAQGGKNGIKEVRVQKIINDRWKDLQAAFPGAEADQVVVFAAKISISKYLSEFEVSRGKITKFVAPDDKVKAVKGAAADEKGAQARLAALTGLRIKVAAYKAKLVATPKNRLNRAEVAKLVAAASSPIKDQLDQPGVDGEIASTVAAALAPIVLPSGVTVVKGRLTDLTPAPDGLDSARHAKGESDEKARQSAAMTALTEALEAYKETKTKSGSRGVKETGVQERILKATEKVPAWVASGSADDAIKQIVLDTLTPMVTSLEVKKGRVGPFVAPEDVAAEAKRDRKENGKARLKGGEKDDNVRRRMVSNALRGEVTKYAAQVRGDAEKAAQTGKPATVRLEKAKLQSIINAGIKTIRADVVNEVGDRAIETVARDRFGPMLTKITVEKAQIDDFVPDESFAAVAKAKRDTSAQVRRAQSDLTADLTTYGREVAKIGRAPSKSSVQAIINKHKAKFAALGDEADTAMEMAVGTAFGNSLRKVTIVGGVLGFFLPAAPPVPSR